MQIKNYNTDFPRKLCCGIIPMFNIPILPNNMHYEPSICLPSGNISMVITLYISTIGLYFCITCRHKTGNARIKVKLRRLRVTTFAVEKL
jgi:hypothetical protein